MQRRPYNLLWFFLALVFAGQSLLPVAALAQVSMRCAGAPAASPPCAQGTVVATDAAPIDARFVAMACCRTMANCPMMASAGERPAPQTLRAFSLSAPKCVVSVKVFGTKSATLGPQAHRWLLTSVPALAPPQAAASSLSETFAILVAFPGVCSVLLPVPSPLARPSCASGFLTPFLPCPTGARRCVCCGH